MRGKYGIHAGTIARSPEEVIEGGLALMKYTMTSPCDGCPFLIGSGFTWKSLTKHASGEFACHKACDLTEDDVYQARDQNTPHCAGALIFLEKQEKPHQMMRICERLGFYDRTKLNMEANVGRKTSDYALMKQLKSRIEKDEKR